METVISNKEIEYLLNNYAKEVYGKEWQKVEAHVYMNTKSKYMGDGDYSSYIVMEASISFEKKKTIKALQDREFNVIEKIFLSEQEITEIIREILRKEELELDFVSVGKEETKLYFKEKVLRRKLINPCVKKNNC